MVLNRYKKNLSKRREAGTWLEPRRYEKEIYLLERLALETCFQKYFAVGMTAMYAGYAIGKRTGRKKGGSGAVMGGLLFYLLAVLKLKGQN